ncbi:MAG: methyltransferase domain-containing protein [Cyanobacteria bacterium J06633_8]
MGISKYTEAETEGFYDSEDSLYRSFWDSEGSLHWGYFDNLATESQNEFLPACKRWNSIMLQRSGITDSSRVLDMGCGNGNAAVWLAQQTGCEVVGIDISQVRIDNAQNLVKDYPGLNISFKKASATNLPFETGAFTHVWSQATLYHVHDRIRALEEIHRVLEEGGTFLFDDLVTPRSEISESSRRYVYERLLFEPTFSQESYTENLGTLGLMVLEATNLSLHLRKSYQLLSQLALPHYPDLNGAYTKMCEAIDKQDLGWSFYLCKKVSDRLSWIYETSDKQSLEKKYDAWSGLYDSELDRSYRVSPIQSAQALTKVLSNKQASILDAGAGTGMVGETLAELGYTNITAVDLSSEMLKIAEKKQVYQALYQGDLQQTLDFAQPSSFDAIISVGVFTYGHVEPQALHNLFDLLKSGGYFVLTVRVDYYESNESLQQIIDELSWNLCDRVEFNIFDTESMYALIFQKK